MFYSIITFSNHNNRPLSTLKEVLCKRTIKDLKSAFFSRGNWQTDNSDVRIVLSIDHEEEKVCVQDRLTDYNKRTDEPIETFEKHCFVFNDYFAKQTSSHFEFICRSINDRLDEIESNEGHIKRYLTKMNSDLKDILENPNAIRLAKDLPAIKSLIDNLSIFLDKKFQIYLEVDSHVTPPLTQANHPKGSVMKSPERPEVINFGFKGDDQLLEKLYNIQIDGKRVFKNEKYNIKAFKNLMSDDISAEKSDKKIIFGIESQQAAYILKKKLPSYFTNLTLDSIEQSAVFYTKGDTVFTKKLINQYSKRYTDNSFPKSKDLIDDIFLALKIE